MQNSKCVYLVGTGPGDPDLLTVKALRLIQSADVVVYDRLVSAEIVNLIPHGIARIYVGKQTGNHTYKQDQINALLGRLAQTNRCVVRLKGGDPMVFGRGSEEALYLSQHNVCFEVVPGITSASACTTYAGIPLTHRGLANQVNIITGHCQEDAPLNYDWMALANTESTLVVYMGVAQIGEITNQLMTHGLSAQTPAAAIEQGTTAQQRVCITSLGELTEEVSRSGLKAPVMFVIGKVVSLASELDWFVSQEAMHAEASQA